MGCSAPWWSTRCLCLTLHGARRCNALTKRVHRDSDMTNLCNHKRKLVAMAAFRHSARLQAETDVRTSSAHPPFTGLYRPLNPHSQFYDLPSHICNPLTRRAVTPLRVCVPPSQLPSSTPSHRFCPPLFQGLIILEVYCHQQ